jgi:predicted transcriptional regulator
MTNIKTTDEQILKKLRETPVSVWTLAAKLNLIWVASLVRRLKIMELKGLVKRERINRLDVWSVLEKAKN